MEGLVWRGFSRTLKAHGWACQKNIRQLGGPFAQHVFFSAVRPADYFNTYNTFLVEAAALWCYNFLTVNGFVRNPDDDPPTSVPLPGLKRREAIRCCGPLQFGAARTTGAL